MTTTRKRGQRKGIIPALGPNPQDVQMDNLIAAVTEARDMFGGLLGEMKWPSKPSNKHREKVTDVMMAVYYTVFDPHVAVYLDKNNLTEWSVMIPRQASYPPPYRTALSSDDEGDSPMEKTSEQLMDEAGNLETMIASSSNAPQEGASKEDDFDDNEAFEKLAEKLSPKGLRAASQEEEEDIVSEIVGHIRKLGAGWVEELKEGRLEQLEFNNWKDKVLKAVKWTDCRSNTGAALDKVRQPCTSHDCKPSLTLGQIAQITNPNGDKPSLDDYGATPIGKNILEMLMLHEPTTPENIQVWQNWWTEIKWCDAPRVANLAGWYVAHHKDFWANNLVVNPSLLSLEKIALRLTTLINLANQMHFRNTAWQVKYTRALARLTKGDCGSVSSVRAALQGLVPNIRNPDDQELPISMRPFNINFDTAATKQMDDQLMRKGIGPTLNYRTVPIGIQASKYWEAFDNESEKGEDDDDQSTASSLGDIPGTRPSSISSERSAFSPISGGSTGRTRTANPPSKLGKYPTAAATRLIGGHQRQHSQDANSAAERLAKSQRALEQLRRLKDLKRKKAPKS